MKFNSHLWKFYAQSAEISLRVDASSSSLSNWCMLLRHPYTNSALNTTQIISQVFNLLFNNFIMLLKVKFKRWLDDCTASLHMCMNIFLPAHVKTALTTGIFQALQNFIQLQRWSWTCVCLLLQRFIFCVWLKLVNPSLVLHALLNAVQPSKHWQAQKTFTWVQSDIIQCDNKAEMINSNLQVLRVAVSLWQDYSAAGHCSMYSWIPLVPSVSHCNAMEVIHYFSI